MGVPLGIVLAVVAAIAVVAGFTLYATGNLALSVQKDAESVLLLSINRSNAVESYEIKYAVENSVKSTTDDVQINGSMGITKYGDTKRIAYELEFLGSPTVIEIYQSPGETITCSAPFGERLCQKIPTAPPVQSPVEQQEQLQKQLEDGVVSLSYTGESRFAGRTCDTIRASYDIQKLIDESEDQVGQGARAIKSMTLDVCIDTESGLPLSTVVNMVIDSPQAKGSVMTALTASSFRLSAEEIEIPEAEEAQQPPLEDLGAGLDETGQYEEENLTY